MKILGHRHTMTNDCTVEIERRIVAAWCAFKKHSQLLTSKAGSLKTRFEALHRFVLPALRFNVGVLNLRQDHLRRRPLQHRDPAT